ISSNSSSQKSSHSLHHFSSQDSLKGQTVNEFSQKLKNQVDSDEKMSFKSSLNKNILESRLQNVAKEHGLTVNVGVPKVEEENEGIVTTPKSTVTSPTLTSPPFHKYEHRKATSAAKALFIGDGIKAEKEKETNDESARLQSKDMDFEGSSSHSAMRARLEGNGISASKISTRRQDQRQMRINDQFHQQMASSKATAMKLSSENLTSEKKLFEAQKEELFTSQGVKREQKNFTSSSSSKFVSKSSTVTSSISSSSSNINQMTSDSPIITEPLSPEAQLMIQDIDIDFNNLAIRPEEVGQAKSEKAAIMSSVTKIKNKMNKLVEKLKDASKEESIDVLKAMNNICRRAWLVPNHGHELGFALCKTLKTSGGLQILINNCKVDDSEVQFRSAQVLEQSLTEENRAFVVDNAMKDVVDVALDLATKNIVAHQRVGIGILNHMFKNSEETCKALIKMGSLKTILYKCRATDVETLRHCAQALANLSLYGGPENQLSMINEKASMWLFPLAFHYDDNVKYYACLATASLVANKEIEAAVLSTGTLNLLDSFVFTNNPQEFAENPSNRIYGQPKSWLLKLVPVLESDREEAKSLAAFHFAVEACIKKKQGNTTIFHEIGAIGALKKVASSPNAVASKFAAQALKLIGEVVPHKLSQQVPLWTVDDVKEWVKQIGFSHYAQEFVNSRVDGDLLLQLNEEMLKEDINMKNGILRKRFMRELGHLKRLADYSSCDPSNIHHILSSLGPVYGEYTYSMLQCGVDSETLKMLSEEQLFLECKIENSIHRFKVAETIRSLNQQSCELEENADSKKPLDVFISYRRSNGSQLASLLKVHLETRGFTAFLDVERLRAGKFDSNLIKSIKQAKYFILVLTQSALDRCVGDNECKDWVHREIVEALQNKCEIIPIIDNFQWPEAETLPEDMRAVCYFNGIRWIHEYQDACVDKLERFLRGEVNTRLEGPAAKLMGIGGVPGTPGTPKSSLAYQRKDSADTTRGSQDLLNHI
ncbi:Sterile alpha and TIR motif-containing protein 1-like protein, partial [Dinothrombium tinctorium]